MRFTVALGVFCLIPFAGLAAPATEQGAAHLTEVLQRYLGKTDGVIDVKPQGETYRLTVDLLPQIRRIPSNTGSTSLTPIVMDLTDNGDGTWGVTLDQSDFALNLAVPEALQLDMTAADLRFSGTFDERLMTWTRHTSSASDLTVTEVVGGGPVDPQNVSYHLSGITMTGEGHAAATGQGVDSSYKMVVSGMDEVMDIPGGTGLPTPLTLRLAIGSASQSGTITDFRPEAFLNLLSFFVAHPEKAAILSDQEQLRQIVTDGLPLWQTMHMEAQDQDISVETPVGTFGLATADVVADINGVTHDGLFREGLSAKGLTMPPGLVPDWATSLVPGEFSVDFKATGYDLAAAAGVILPLIDLRKDPPVSRDKGPAVLAALLPKGLAEVSITPSDITAPDYRFGYQGTLSFGPGQDPVGTAHLTMTGLDQVQKTLQNAPPDVGAYPMMGAGMVRGMAKPGTDGELIWDIELTEGGKVLVNGVDMESLANMVPQ